MVSIILSPSVTVPIPFFKEGKKHGNLVISVVQVGIGRTHGRSVLLLTTSNHFNFIYFKQCDVQMFYIGEKGSNLIDMSLYL